MKSQFSLPPWLQILVAIATILSSCAVFIYIIQLVVTRRQFREQLRITNRQFDTQMVITRQQFKEQIELNKQQFDDQIKLTRDQFTAQNQGYLSVSVKVTFLVHGVVPDDITLDTEIKQFVLDLILQNVGNLPISQQFEYLKTFRDGHEIIKPNKVDFPIGTIYPRQEPTSISLGVITLENPIKIADFNNYNITTKYRVNYHDLGNTHMKKVERTEKIEIFKGQAISKTLELNDAI